MKNLAIVFFLTLAHIASAQTAGVVLARTYADAALVKAHGREYIKDINIEIIEWKYDSATDRFYTYFNATYKTWDVVAWFNNTSKAQLECNLDGSAAKLKYDGFFESWTNLGSIR